MGNPGMPRFSPAVDSAGEGLHRLQERLFLDLETPPGRLIATDAAEETIHRKGIRPDQGGEGSAPEALQGLELEGPVLPLAETHGEPGIDIVCRPDMGYPPAVAQNLHFFPDTIDAKAPLGNRQSLAEQETKERAGNSHQVRSRIFFSQRYSCLCLQFIPSILYQNTG
jgi:hypothetical protein